MIQEKQPALQSQIQNDIREITNLLQQILLILEAREGSVSLNKLLNYDEAATLLDVQVGSLRGWIHQQRVPHVKMGKAVRFDPRELLEWIKTHSIPASEVGA